jgi:hypothetical protein
MTIKNQLLVELVLRKKQITDIPEQFNDIITEFKQFESEDRLVLDVPSDWSGFKDGTIISMLKTFNEAMYIALAYFTNDLDVVITDFDGEAVDKYETTYQGKRVAKYVKKRLRIITLIDKDKNIFNVVGYELDIKYPEPVVKVLDAYSGGYGSGIHLGTFLKPGSNYDKR